MSRHKHVRQVVEGSGLASLVLEYPQGAEPGVIAQWLNEAYGTEFTRAHIEGFLLRARKKGYKGAMIRTEIAEVEHSLSESIDTLEDLLEEIKSTDANMLVKFNKDKAQIEINTILAMSKLIKERRAYLKERLKLYELETKDGEEPIDLTEYPPSINEEQQTPPPLNPDSLK